MSNTTNTGCLVFSFGDEILPSYVGIIFLIHDIRIPSLTNQYSTESIQSAFFLTVAVAQVDNR